MFRVNKKRIVLFLVLCLLAIGLLRYFKPIPLAQFHLSQELSQWPAQKVELPWPSYGHGAVGAVGYGLLKSSSQLRPGPIASTAKVMTALAILEKKPLSLGQDGQKIVVTKEDVAAYQQARSQGQSVLPVKVGEKLSEYQALQAILVPSANNVAAILANWAFGSIDNYSVYANQKAKELGMDGAFFADASGYSADTVASASDLVILGLEAMKNPVISSIVAQHKVNLPVAGTVKNVNWLLGNSGIVGIKTGNTDQAGGCYLLAAKRTIDGQPITIVTAVMNEPDLTTAMTQAKALLFASEKEFKLAKEKLNGSYSSEWEASANVTQRDISTLVWTGNNSKASSVLVDLPAGSKAGDLAGTVTIKNGIYSKSEKVYLAQDISEPSFWWRIFRN